MEQNLATKQPSPFKQWFKRTANGTITFLGVPANTILIFFAIVLLLLNISPIVSLLVKSFTKYSVVGTGDFTFENFANVFNGATESVGVFYKPFLRSLLVSTLSCVFAIFFGGLSAYLITRTNMKLKKFISMVFIFPYIMPQWTLALFWKNLFISTNCLAGHVGEFQALTGIAMPQWFVYGPFPISLVLGLHYAPFAYILFGGLMQNLDSNLEEAATILGIPRWKNFLKVTLPILKPALLSTVLLVFSSAMSSYSVAVELGNPVNYTVLATSMAAYISGMGGLFAGRGSVMAIVLIAVGVFLLIINQIQTGSRKQFTTVTGKSGQVTKNNLGKAGKWIVGIVLATCVIFFCVGPMVSFFLESLLPNPGDYSSGLTWKAWFSRTPVSTNDFVGFFHEKKIGEALKGSIVISIACALLAGSSGFLIGYAVSKKRKSKGGKFVNGLAFFPYLMPSIALSQCFYLLGVNLKMAGMWMLVGIVVGTLKYIPMASRSSLNAMLQLSGEIEEAGIIQGIPWWKRMTRIVFPIQKAAIISGFLLPFISCMREYDLFVFIGNDRLTLTRFMFQLGADGCPALENAANFVLIAIILLVNWLTNILTGASIDKGLGGSK